MIKKFMVKQFQFFLLLTTLLTSSLSYGATYNLELESDFKQLCTYNGGGQAPISINGSEWAREYRCHGIFSSRNNTINLYDNSVVKADQTFNITNTEFKPVVSSSGNEGTTTLSGAGGGESSLSEVTLPGSILGAGTLSLSNSSIHGNVDASYGITIIATSIGSDVSGGGSFDLSNGSSIGGDVQIVDGATVENSSVTGDIKAQSLALTDASVGGNTNVEFALFADNSSITGYAEAQSINLTNDSSIGGYAKAASTDSIMIDNSSIVGDASAQKINATNAFIGGNADTVYELDLTDSTVQGNVTSINSNIDLSGNTIIMGDATASTPDNGWAIINFNDNSIVHGTCLHRTYPVDACDSTEPPINQNPQFEFGTLTKDSCRIIESGTNDDADRQRVSCTLEFDKTYTTVPLVFVMPTIDASLSVLSARTTELPSTASVIGTSLTSATVVQEIAPSAKRNTSNTTYLDAPMLSDEDLNSLNIDYFVIQEGVISLGSGKGRIVAGLVETNTAASQISNERSNADIVNFENYGLSSFSNTPGVLVQPQTKNNSSAWFTGMARGVNTERFYLALEKSEVINNNDISEPEKVAFVAGEGSGITQGARFFLGSGETRVTTTLNEKVISPIEIGCEESTSISEANFDAPPILIANKNSRSGNNGGWVRRCHVTEDEVYFIVEEDMDKDSERSHIAEDVGFFMFDRPNELGICDGFNNKSPVQTWIRTDGTIGAFEAYNSSRVIGSFKDGNRRYLGFDDDGMTDGTSWSTGGACDGLECSGLEDLMVPKELLEDMPDNLTVSVNVNAGDTLTLPLTDSDGQPIYEYQTLNVGGIVTIEAGKYKIGSINVWEDGEVQVKSGDSVTIFTNKFQLNNRAFFGVPIDSRGVDKPTLDADTYMRVNVLESNSNSVNINSNSSTKPSTFVGLLYSEQPVRISNGARIYGGVAAESVHMSGQSLISAATSCMLPSDDYEIEISPATDLALMCGDDSPQFTINTSNNGVGESLGVTVSITPDADEFDVSVLQGQDSATYPNYVSNDDGELTLKVVAKNTANIDFDTGYKLTATLVDDAGKEVESQFKFVPFKFSLVDGDSPTNRLDVIAGQATPTVTKVLACDLGDSIVVAENYVGEAEKQVTITHELDNSWSGSDGALTYLPEFESGSATTDLTISESGLFNVTLKDSSFDCTGFAGCPEDGSYDLEGSFSIYSRPWQFAICTDNNSDGNSSSGAAFVAAGEEFDVFAKPIRFTNDASQLCNNNLVTQNYLISSGAVGANHTLDTPSNGDVVLGRLEPTSQLIQSSSDIVSSDNGYKFKSLKYSEVGSINFEVTENSNSFYGKILGGFSGNKNIGRFYPDYLTLISNSWNYSSGHDSFAYMAQGISFNFIVEARNRDNEPVTNYGLFADSLKASIKHVAIDEDSSVLNTRVWLSGGKDADHISWGEDDWSSARLTIENFDYEFLRLASEDGPYDNTNSEFGVWVSDKVDGVDLQFLDLDNTNTDYTNGTKFSFQPDFRYGRMSLKDVGGNQGRKIQVPLEVQYWSGSKFEINSDDSGSQFNGSDYCVTKIWDDAEPTDAKLTSDIDDDGNDDTVSVLNGISSNLIAKQETSRREQVRLFLRQGSSPSGATCFGSEGGQPWLQYNWRGLGDEDPSTVVTFGIYRGNDRVIYRGESGLTGQ
ncbi:hypothetical protein BCU69_19755 [Vibrio cyclitrophicus]|uniref:DUF6701 domain-containing protein n=2 Tax=Vibrio cyclitrophicus TaxID=47951 RepID=UPI000CACB234|nr:hypothetical protein BCU69_19755 [Vibrio cyclitrophicus]